MATLLNIGAWQGQVGGATNLNIGAFQGTGQSPQTPVSQVVGSIVCKMDEEGSNTAMGTRLEFYTTAKTTLTNTLRLTIDGDGKLKIAGLTASTALYQDASQFLTGVALTNGQLLIGSTGAVPVAAGLTGTANQVTVTPGAGTITLSLPQSIAAASTPTFAGLTLTAFAGAVMATAGVLSAGTLTVALGGTGATTLTDHGILLGSGTGAVTPLGVASNGQIPIGSTGADPVLASITGTASQITVTDGAGTITLSLPSAITAPGSIATTSSLTAGTTFGCNGATAQAAYTLNADSTDLATVVALCNQIRAALIANGIGVAAP